MVTRKPDRNGRGRGRQVGELLPGVLRNLGLDRRIEETRLLGAWEEIVGEAVSRRSRPSDVRDGKLIVEVENNVWMQEIRFHKGEILKKIRELFPGVEIRDILLRLERESKQE